MTIDDSRIIQLPKITDSRGNLSIIEQIVLCGSCLYLCGFMIYLLKFAFIKPIGGSAVKVV